MLLAGCAGSGGGRYAMQNDAYPDVPQDVSEVPDAVPRVEPRSRSGNRSSYTVWGKTYHVLNDPTGYVAEGRASFYGAKFQGYDTANGETYDMYRMSAAHRSLPLPTYARVTNLDNGRQVIVRVNDRGPFHGDRLIDLSYAAAARLDILDQGTGRVRVEAIDPRAWAREQGGQAGEASGAGARTPVAPGTVAAPANAGSSESAVASAMASREATRPVPAATTAASADPVESARTTVRYLQVAALGSRDNALALKKRLQGLLSQPVRIDNAASLYRVQVGPIHDLTSLEALRATLNDAGYGQAFVVPPIQ
nr:septal ring lytic transglycosylase RlpA family protein [Salinicola sp. S1-1-2]